jgi:hypothetical protein
MNEVEMGEEAGGEREGLERGDTRAAVHVFI